MYKSRHQNTIYFYSLLKGYESVTSTLLELCNCYSPLSIRSITCGPSTSQDSQVQVKTVKHKSRQSSTSQDSQAQAKTSQQQLVKIQVQVKTFKYRSRHPCTRIQVEYKSIHSSYQPNPVQGDLWLSPPKNQVQVSGLAHDY